ncbi:MAG: hypothetical protein JNM17_29850 [Archangium sp.]|nr:hypothetical protein [Archangium sp.]
MRSAFASVVLVALLFAVPARATETTLVQFEARGPETDVEALRVSLEDWLRPLKLTLRRVQELPVGIDDEIAARVRVVWSDEVCVVEVFKPDGQPVRRKELARQGSPLVISESAALVAHVGIQELLLSAPREGGTSMPPPMVTAPTTPRAPIDVSIAAWFQTRSWDERSPFVFGAGSEVTVALPTGALRPSASLVVAYQGPVVREGSEVSLSMQALSIRLLPGARTRVGAFEFEAGIGGGLDLMIANTRSPVIPRSALIQDRVDAAPFFSAMAGLRFHPTPSSGVLLRVLLDVDPARRRYVANISGEQTLLAVPWAVRPMIQLGFSFDLVRAP